MKQVPTEAATYVATQRTAEPLPEVKQVGLIGGQVLDAFLTCLLFDPPFEVASQDVVKRLGPFGSAAESVARGDMIGRVCDKLGQMTAGDVEDGHKIGSRAFEGRGLKGTAYPFGGQAEKEKMLWYKVFQYAMTVSVDQLDAYRSSLVVDDFQVSSDVATDLAFWKSFYLCVSLSGSTVGCYYDAGKLWMVDSATGVAKVYSVDVGQLKSFVWDVMRWKHNGTRQDLCVSQWNPVTVPLPVSSWYTVETNQIRIETSHNPFYKNLFYFMLFQAGSSSNVEQWWNGACQTSVEEVLSRWEQHGIHVTDRWLLHLDRARFLPTMDPSRVAAILAQDTMYPALDHPAEFKIQLEIQKRDALTLFRAPVDFSATHVDLVEWMRWMIADLDKLKFFALGELEDVYGQKIILTSVMQTMAHVLRRSHWGRNVVEAYETGRTDNQRWVGEAHALCFLAAKGLSIYHRHRSFWMARQSDDPELFDSGQDEFYMLELMLFHVYDLGQLIKSQVIDCSCAVWQRRARKPQDVVPPKSSLLDAPELDFMRSLLECYQDHRESLHQMQGTMQGTMRGTMQGTMRGTLQGCLNRYATSPSCKYEHWPVGDEDENFESLGPVLSEIRPGSRTAAYMLLRFTRFHRHDCNPEPLVSGSRIPAAIVPDREPVTNENMDDMFTMLLSLDSVTDEMILKRCFFPWFHSRPEQTESLWKQFQFDEQEFSKLLTGPQKLMYVCMALSLRTPMIHLLSNETMHRAFPDRPFLEFLCQGDMRNAVKALKRIAHPGHVAMHETRVSIPWNPSVPGQEESADAWRVAHLIFCHYIRQACHYSQSPKILHDLLNHLRADESHLILNGQNIMVALPSGPVEALPSVQSVFADTWERLQTPVVAYRAADSDVISLHVPDQPCTYLTISGLELTFAGKKYDIVKNLSAVPGFIVEKTLLDTCFHLLVQHEGRYFVFLYHGFKKRPRFHVSIPDAFFHQFYTALFPVLGGPQGTDLLFYAVHLALSRNYLVLQHIEHQVEWEVKHGVECVWKEWIQQGWCAAPRRTFDAVRTLMRDRRRLPTPVMPSWIRLSETRNAFLKRRSPHVSLMWGEPLDSTQSAFFSQQLAYEFREDARLSEQLFQQAKDAAIKELERDLVRLASQYHSDSTWSAERIMLRWALQTTLLLLQDASKPISESWTANVCDSYTALWDLDQWYWGERDMELCWFEMEMGRVVQRNQWTSMQELETDLMSAKKKSIHQLPRELCKSSIQIPWLAMRCRNASQQVVILCTEEDVSAMNTRIRRLAPCFILSSPCIVLRDGKKALIDRQALHWNLMIAAPTALLASYLALMRDPFQSIDSRAPPTLLIDDLDWIHDPLKNKVAIETMFSTHHPSHVAPELPRLLSFVRLCETIRTQELDDDAIRKQVTEYALREDENPDALFQAFKQCLPLIYLVDYGPSSDFSRIVPYQASRPRDEMRFEDADVQMILTTWSFIELRMDPSDLSWTLEVNHKYWTHALRKWAVEKHADTLISHETQSVKNELKKDGSFLHDKPKYDALFVALERLAHLKWPRVKWSISLVDVMSHLTHHQIALTTSTYLDVPRMSAYKRVKPYPNMNLRLKGDIHGVHRVNQCHLYDPPLYTIVDQGQYDAVFDVGGYIHDVVNMHSAFKLWTADSVYQRPLFVAHADSTRDVYLPSNARVLITISANTRWNHLIRALARLNRLGRGHSVDFVVDHVDASVPPLLQSRNVMKLVQEVEQRERERGLLSWIDQNIVSIQRIMQKHAQESYMEYNVQSDGRRQRVETFLSTNPGIVFPTWTLGARIGQETLYADPLRILYESDRVQGDLDNYDGFVSDLPFRLSSGITTTLLASIKNRSRYDPLFHPLVYEAGRVSYTYETQATAQNMVGTKLMHPGPDELGYHMICYLSGVRLPAKQQFEVARKVVQLVVKYSFDLWVAFLRRWQLFVMGRELDLFYGVFHLFRSLPYMKTTLQAPEPPLYAFNIHVDNNLKPIWLEMQALAAVARAHEQKLPRHIRIQNTIADTVESEPELKGHAAPLEPLLSKSSTETLPDTDVVHQKVAPIEVRPAPQRTPDLVFDYLPNPVQLMQNGLLGVDLITPFITACIRLLRHKCFPTSWSLLHPFLEHANLLLQSRLGQSVLLSELDSFAQHLQGRSALFQNQHFSGDLLAQYLSKQTYRLDINADQIQALALVPQLDLYLHGFIHFCKNTQETMSFDELWKAIHTTRLIRLKLTQLNQPIANNLSQCALMGYAFRNTNLDSIQLTDYLP